jgi:hypothetical protein
MSGDTRQVVGAADGPRKMTVDPKTGLSVPENMVTRERRRIMRDDFKVVKKMVAWCRTLDIVMTIVCPKCAAVCQLERTNGGFDLKCKCTSRVVDFTGAEK